MTESERAKRWRQANHLTLAEVSKLTGYALLTIHLFERGRNSKNQPHDRHAWQRYKMACLAVTVLKHHKVKSIDQWHWSNSEGRTAGQKGK